MLHLKLEAMQRRNRMQGLMHLEWVLEVSSFHGMGSSTSTQVKVNNQVVFLAFRRSPASRTRTIDLTECVFSEAGQAARRQTFEGVIEITSRVLRHGYDASKTLSADYRGPGSSHQKSCALPSRRGRNPVKIHFNDGLLFDSYYLSCLAG